MSGLIMQFKSLGPGENFIIDDGFNTASICPVAGSSGSYTIGYMVGDQVNGVSPTLTDITSFPTETRTWNAHKISCIAGTVIVKYQTKSI